MTILLVKKINVGNGFVIVPGHNIKSNSVFLRFNGFAQLGVCQREYLDSLRIEYSKLCTVCAKFKYQVFGNNYRIVSFTKLIIAIHDPAFGMKKEIVFMWENRKLWTAQIGYFGNGVIG